jgi:hypothetical protein
MGYFFCRSGTTISENRWLTGPKKWGLGPKQKLRFQFWYANRQNGGTISELDFGFKKWGASFLYMDNTRLAHLLGFKNSNLFAQHHCNTTISSSRVRVAFALYDAKKKL